MKARSTAARRQVKIEIKLICKLGRNQKLMLGIDGCGAMPGGHQPKNGETKKPDTREWVEPQ